MLVIGVDHGNKNIKTTNCLPVVSGFKESRVKPYGTDILEYQNRYYTLSKQRIPYKRDKTEDEKFFILTLFAIARELEKRNAFTKIILPIGLAIGLPPGHYGAQYKSFTEYFKRGMVNFKYNGKEQSIYLSDVKCYPQAYAAAMTIWDELVKYQKVLLIDIGGMTVEYLPMRYGEPELTMCETIENGIIILYNQIRESVSSEFNVLLEEVDIDDILNGKETLYSKEVADMICSMAADFMENLFNSLREKQFDLKSSVVVFAGGGALGLKMIIEKSEKLGKVIFIDNINANAQGYELLFEMGV